MSDKKIRQPVDGSKAAQLRELRERRQKIIDAEIPPFCQAAKRPKVPPAVLQKTVKAAELAKVTLAEPKGGIDPKFIAEQKAAAQTDVAKAKIKKLERDARKLEAEGRTRRAAELREKKAAIAMRSPELLKATAASAVEAPQQDASTPRADNTESKMTPRTKTSKKSSKSNARQAVKAKTKSAGNRSRYDWKAAEEKATKGVVPPALDFSAETHARFRPVLDEVLKAAKSGDVDALRKIKIKPVSSSPKALDRYRKLCLLALKAA